MSPVNYTIFSRADNASSSVTEYYIGNFLAWYMIGFCLSFSGIFVFFIVKPTWGMHKRRLAVLAHLKEDPGSA